MANTDGSGEIRDLKLLETLSREPEIKQADLAAQLGMAVGTVNWLLKRLAAKGYVKVKRIGQWRWRYLITPQGVAAKARLTKAYIQRSMQLYRKTRERAQTLLQEAEQAGYDCVQIMGDVGNELVDICRLTCLEKGIKVVSAVENPMNHEPRTANPINSTDPMNPTNPMNHANIPMLRVEGQRLSLDWPANASND